MSGQTVERAMREMFCDVLWLTMGALIGARLPMAVSFRLRGGGDALTEHSIIEIPIRGCGAPDVLQQLGKRDRLQCLLYNLTQKAISDFAWKAKEDVDESGI